MADSRSQLDTLKERLSSLDERQIDELYGLEPRYEPGEAHGRLGDYAEYLCPWCCENIGTTIDLVAAERNYIEDCQVCCQPIEIEPEISSNGSLVGVLARRVE